MRTDVPHWSLALNLCARLSSPQLWVHWPYANPSSQILFWVLQRLVHRPCNTHSEELLPSSSVALITLPGSHLLPSCSPLCLWASDSPAPTAVKIPQTRPQIHPRASIHHPPAKCNWAAPVLMTHMSTTGNLTSALTCNRGVPRTTGAVHKPPWSPPCSAWCSEHLEAAIQTLHLEIGPVEPSQPGSDRRC